MNWIIPMEPVISEKIMEGDEFVHEIKWDGIRGLVYHHDDETKIYTKKGNERTAFYPEITDVISKTAGEDFIIDGEIIVPDSKGIPSFHDCLIRETVKNKRRLEYYLENYPVIYMVFDVLQYKDKLLTLLPLIERKQFLAKVMEVIGENNIICLSQVYTDGAGLYDKMKQENMEGIVSKRVNSLYIEGKKHNDWFKTKFTKKMLCVVGGIQWKDGSPNSLILGINTGADDGLKYMGKASLGLKVSDLMLLKEYRNELARKECPFEAASLSDINITGSELTWMIPSLTCWISFLEFSNDGHFRHAKIAGFTNMSAAEAKGRVYTD